VYASVDQLRSVLCRDERRRSTTAASLSDDDLTEALKSASGEVDGAATKAGYGTPFPADRVPHLVKAVTLALAAWMADLTFRQGVAHENRLDPVLQRYDWAQALLVAWAKRDKTIPGADDPSSVGSGDVVVGAPINRYDGQLFGPEELAPAVPPFGEDRFYDPDYWRWGHGRGWL
jgi:hypothetical protein